MSTSTRFYLPALLAAAAALLPVSAAPASAAAREGPPVLKRLVTKRVDVVFEERKVVVSLKRPSGARGDRAYRVRVDLLAESRFDPRPTRISRWRRRVTLEGDKRSRVRFSIDPDRGNAEIFELLAEAIERCGGVNVKIAVSRKPKGSPWSETRVPLGRPKSCA